MHEETLMQTRIANDSGDAPASPLNDDLLMRPPNHPVSPANLNLASDAIVLLIEAVGRAMQQTPCGQPKCKRCSLVHKLRRVAAARGLTTETVRTDPEQVARVGIQLFEARDEIEAAQRAMQHQKSRADKLETDLKHGKELLKKLGAQVREYEARLANTAALQNPASLHELAATREQLASAQRTEAELRAELVATQETHVAERDELKKRLEKAEQDIDDLLNSPGTSEVQELRDRLAARERDIDELLSHPGAHALDPEIQAKLDEHGHLMDEVARLQAEARSNTERVNALQTELESTQAALATERTARSISDRKLHAAEEIFEERERVRKKLEQQLAITEARAKEISEKLHERTQRIRELGISLNQEEWARKKAEERRETSDRESEERRIALAAVRTDLERLEEEHALLQSTLERTQEKHRDELARLHEANDALQARGEAAHNEAQRVLDALTQAREAFSRLLGRPLDAPTAPSPSAIPLEPTRAAPATDEVAAQLCLEQQQSWLDQTHHEAAELDGQVNDLRRQMRILEHQRDYQCSSDEERNRVNAEINTAQSALDPLLARQQVLQTRHNILSRRVSELRRFLDAIGKVRAGLSEDSLSGGFPGTEEEAAAILAKTSCSDTRTSNEPTSSAQSATGDQPSLETLAELHGLTPVGILVATLLDVKPQQRQHVGIERLLRAARAVGVTSRLKIPIEEDGSISYDWQGARRTKKIFEIYAETGPSMPGQDANLFRRSTEPLTWEPSDVLTPEELAGYAEAYNTAKAPKPEWLQKKAAKT